jgi:hypothetical protein
MGMGVRFRGHAAEWTGLRDDPVHGVHVAAAPVASRRRPPGAAVAGGVGVVLIVAGVIAGTVVARDEIYVAVRVVALAVSHHWPAP